MIHDDMSQIIDADGTIEAGSKPAAKECVQRMLEAMLAAERELLVGAAQVEKN